MSTRLLFLLASEGKVVRAPSPGHVEVEPIPMGDMEPSPEKEPWVCLLPGPDPTVMGWKERGWFLGNHQILLLDANGNAGPTVLGDGRVVGGWAQRGSGEIAVRLLEHVGWEAEERSRLRPPGCRSGWVRTDSPIASGRLSRES